MHIPLKHFFANRFFLTITSVYLGYMLWFTISMMQHTHMWIDVPVCYYNMPQNLVVNAPETIQVELQGKRSVLAWLNTDHLSAHINADTFTAGTHTVKLAREQLLVSDDIEVTRYCPNSIQVTAYEEESTTR